jgi:O-antigen/teichoic acid export membrane protein
MYVGDLISSLTTILSIILAIILIKSGFGIHLIKLGSAVVYCLNPLFLYIYAHKKYKIIKDVEPDNTSIKQRWDAFAHQVALFIHTNTDTMILTIFTSLEEVSVYSVYNQIVNGVYTILKCFFPSIDAAFGEMFAREEKEAIKRAFNQFVVFVFSISTIMFTVTIGMILSFVRIYTKGVSDVDYIRPVFGYILALASYFFSIRVPYQNVIEAIGHYKQTKKYSYIEAIANLLVSIILVYRIGLVGVAIGTLVANAFRTICYVFYISNHLIDGAAASFVKHLMISVASGTAVLLLFRWFPLEIAANYLGWLLHSLLIGVLISIVVLFTDFITDREETLQLIKRAVGLANRVFKRDRKRKLG